MELTQIAGLLGKDSIKKLPTFTQPENQTFKSQIRKITLNFFKFK